MKNYDLVKLYADYNIDCNSDGSNSAAGWLNTKCPYCEDSSNHLGYNIHSNYFNCWKCGWHPVDETLSILLDIHKADIPKLLKEYKTHFIESDKKPVRTIKQIQLPSSLPLNNRHRQYLSDRDFNPDKLIERYNLTGTSHIGNYKFRIIAPILYGQKIVSYQGRDITEKSKTPYKACPNNEEIRPHKHCLYALDNVPGDTVIIVEGITDVWRLGNGAVATFGIKFKLEQVNLLRRFKKRYIFFDNDPDAQKQANKLANLLSHFDGETYELFSTDMTDPGALKQSQADNIMKEIGLK